METIRRGHPMTHDNQALVDYLDAVKDWGWRIPRVGHNYQSFAPLVGLHATQFSQWVSGKRTPHLTNFCKVENKLKELEAEKGVNHG